MMPTRKTTPLGLLLHRLKEAGIDPKYVLEHSLPSWWDDDCAITHAGFQQSALLIARHLGLDVASLLDTERKIEFVSVPPARFKKHVDTDLDKGIWAVSVARQAATLVVQAVENTTYHPLPSTAREIRRQVQNRVPGLVTLDTLLEWCWASGIPVIHLAFLPQHKPQAIAIRISNRPVIVLCDNHKQDPWQAFLIAHELTHFASGHVLDDDFRSESSKRISSEDLEEKAANAGACEILTGNPETAFCLDHAVSTTQLSLLAQEYGKRHQIDPGAVLLNLSHQQKEYLPLAIKTVNEIAPDADAPARIRDIMKKHLNTDNLSEDAAEFLLHVSGL